MTPSAIAPPLLSWYDQFKRDLPWRAKDGTQPDPYRVWLSEVMLQQTTVAAVAPRFNRFIDRWPRVEVLAAAPDEEVMAEWAGLGYYARARNLLKCARTVAKEHGGRFPDTEELLRMLPGVGAYTAAAIAAIAFNQPSSPVDGNIERVASRLFRIETPLPAAKKEIKTAAAAMTPAERPGDFAQALMDLGATVCLPRHPRCTACPLVNLCEAKKSDLESVLPIKPVKQAKPTRIGQAYWVENSRGDVLLRRRKQNGLLGGMIEIPSFGWSSDDAPKAVKELTDHWTEVRPINHVFTHFRLELKIFCGRTDKEAIKNCFWAPVDRLTSVGLPSVMKKVAEESISA